METAFLLYSQLDDRLACRRYQTAVSLHSHTCHSRESVAIIPGIAQKLLGALIHRLENRRGMELDLTRVWWTPPLSPADAWRVESEQISRLLSMKPMVSLTDHDNIDAVNALAVVDAGRDHPFSIEWTVPFRESFFHLGVHNLPPASAAQIVAGMQEFTAQPSEAVLAEILASLDGLPGVLIVFNHPCWDEKGVGAVRHGELLGEFLNRYQAFLHALELNGLRPWKENQEVMAVAEATGFPLISGGDRHGHEPNAVVNITNAGSFNEFVEEVRYDAFSLPVFLPQYNGSRAWRVAQTVWEVLRTTKQDPLGVTRWTDRVFYRCDDGVVRSLTSLFARRRELSSESTTLLQVDSPPES